MSHTCLSLVFLLCSATTVLSQAATRIVLPDAVWMQVGETKSISTAFDAAGNIVEMPTPLTPAITTPPNGTGQIVVSGNRVTGKQAGTVTLQFSSGTIVSNSTLITIVPAAPSEPNEMGRFDIPPVADVNDPVEIRTLLNSEQVGGSGYGQCYVVVGVRFFRCLRSKNWVFKYGWADWRWVNGNIERDALTTKIGEAGYGSIFGWAGSLWASKPRP